MLASFTINLDNQTIPAVASGVLVLIAGIAGRGGIAYILSHIWYAFRRTLKGATLNFKTLAIVNTLCGAGLISGTSYLPTWVGAENFPLMYVVGLALPVIIAIGVTLIIALDEDSDALSRWRYNYTDKSRYVETNRVSTIHG